MPTAALRNGKCGPRKRIKMAIIVGRSEDSCDESSLFRCTLRLSSFPTATGLGRWLCYLSQTASQTFSYCCRRPLAVAQFLSMENASQRSNRVRLLDPSLLSGASSASHSRKCAPMPLTPAALLLERRPSARLLAQSCKRQICHTLPGCKRLLATALTSDLYQKKHFWRHFAPFRRGIR